METLRDRIRKGESTGNPAKDFVIANYGTLDPATVRPYEEFQAQLRGKEGTHVLLVRTEQYPVMMRCFSGIPSEREEEMATSTSLELGILDEGFKLDPTIANIIPVRDHRYAGRREHERWALHEGDIVLHEHEASMLYQGHTKQDGLCVLLGHLPAVSRSEWALHVDDKVTEYFKRRGRLDLSYVDALNILGAQVPPDFQREYATQRKTEKLVLLRDLEDLDAQERMLKRMALKGTTESASELERIRERIRGLLKEAIDLGFHQEDLTLPASTPGAEINMRRFLAELITAHEVEAPSR